MNLRYYVLSITIMILCIGQVEAYQRDNSNADGSTAIIEFVYSEDRLYIVPITDVNLTGIEIHGFDVNREEVERIILNDFSFDELGSSTLAEGECIRYTLADSSGGPPDECSDIQEEAPMLPDDRFWYDRLDEDIRGFAVIQDGEVIESCTNTNTTCRVEINQDTCLIEASGFMETELSWRDDCQQTFDGHQMVLVPQNNDSSAYWIDQFEVSREQYERCDVDGCRSLVSFERDNTALPISYVNYEQAQAYCQWRSDLAGDGVTIRLPTLEEWRWAGQGPNNFVYPWGDSSPNESLAVFDGNSISETNSLYGTPSWVGTYHQSGNLAEIISDNYSPTVFYTIGGSFQDSASQIRLDAPEVDWYADGGEVGFRCIREIN